MNFVGQDAIPFELIDIDGKAHSLGDFNGSWLLIVFLRHLG